MMMDERIAQAVVKARETGSPVEVVGMTGRFEVGQCVSVDMVTATPSGRIYGVYVPRVEITAINDDGTFGSRLIDEAADVAFKGFATPSGPSVAQVAPMA